MTAGITDFVHFTMVVTMFLTPPFIKLDCSNPAVIWHMNKAIIHCLQNENRQNKTRVMSILSFYEDIGFECSLAAWSVQSYTRFFYELLNAI